MNGPANSEGTAGNIVELDMPVGAIMISLTCRQGVNVSRVILHSPAFLNVGQSAGEGDIDNVKLSQNNVRNCLVKGHW